MMVWNVRFMGRRLASLAVCGLALACSRYEPATNMDDESSEGADGAEDPDSEGSTGDPDAPTASEAAAAMGVGVNLGQMFDNTQHPRTVAAATAKIDAYYDMGYRNVRIPVTWTEPVGGDLLVLDPAVGDVDREHPRLQVIAEVIDHALAKPDLYVVLNAHHEVALKTESRAAVLERLWTDIEDIFGDRDHRLVFELLNEPHREDTTPMPAADLRAMSGLAYDAIRAADPQRIIIIGGNQWFGAAEVPAVWTSLDEVGGGADPYVMATFHHYNPWTFCGDNQGDYDDPWTEADLSGPMQTMQAWADGVGGGMPVYIGEWGVGYGSVLPEMDCNNVRAWYQGMHAVHATSFGQPTAVWDDGGWFGIWNHDADAFGNNLAECILGECEWSGDDRFNASCLAP
ncbi:hypothetical protein PPSIR1_20034 [Plesiocystis pacifica SIR-1]|uniref:Glycoside hydrolase family 5 domain-containing protein n=1 Tax=Plesiocystis pacifica SIR-1 TaxID=391625 RepID=A6GGX2_9BACT|nr:cellulase family glycosylhydrolase [Plesiocystis pacifica]EDM74857.1 hypothetical protein PPSIR1_20034 [Plesiocystis pacifica SIR-1]